MEVDRHRDFENSRSPEKVAIPIQNIANVLPQFPKGSHWQYFGTSSLNSRIAQDSTTKFFPNSLSPKTPKKTSIRSDSPSIPTQNIANVCPNSLKGAIVYILVLRVSTAQQLKISTAKLNPNRLNS